MSGLRSDDGLPAPYSRWRFGRVAEELPTIIRNMNQWFLDERIGLIRHSRIILTCPRLSRTPFTPCTLLECRTSQLLSVRCFHMI